MVVRQVIVAMVSAVCGAIVPDQPRPGPGHRAGRDRASVLVVEVR